LFVRAAGKILPVRKNGNLLLCTLLLGNVAVNTLLGILMADITGGTVGFITSTALIVIFGEIIPQALFSRYALQVGEKAVPAVKVIIALFYIIAKPLAFALDKILGHELGTTYSKSELSKLLEMHVTEGLFNQEVGTAMKGALHFQDMLVKEVMTPLKNTFMINVDDKLNFDKMSEIFKTGYSRIPVYESTVGNVIGLLFVKDLIFLDPEDATSVGSLMKIFGRKPHIVEEDDKLGDVLRFLKQGSTHLALVRGVRNGGNDLNDPVHTLQGIITLEDIIEEILGEEIVDETDAWVDGHHTEEVDRESGFDWARLRVLDSRIVNKSLSENEVIAVATHMRHNYGITVEKINDKQLNQMIAKTGVTELEEVEKEAGEVLPPSSKLLYEKGVQSNVCTLVLQGKITVLAGDDNFRSESEPWSILATGALLSDIYAPDFSAYVSSGPFTCLRFEKDIFDAACDKTSLEKSPQNEEPLLKEDVVDVNLHGVVDVEAGLTLVSDEPPLGPLSDDKLPSAGIDGKADNVVERGEKRAKLLAKLLKKKKT
jgi:metal transporter CNNM